MEPIPEIVPCPVCKKNVAEEDKQNRLAEQQSKAKWTMGTIAVILFLIVASCISSHSPQPPKQYFSIGTLNSITPGVNAFQASGKLKLAYACQLKGWLILFSILPNQANSSAIHSSGVALPQMHQ